MQVMLMRLMSKGEHVIVPKGTKFTGAGKLGLKAYSQISYRGRFKEFENFLHLFVALCQEAHVPKGIKQNSFPYEIRGISCIKSHRHDLIKHSSL